MAPNSYACLMKVAACSQPGLSQPFCMCVSHILAMLDGTPIDNEMSMMLFSFLRFAGSLISQIEVFIRIGYAFLYYKMQVCMRVCDA